jgi:hypothetical protein
VQLSDIIISASFLLIVERAQGFKFHDFVYFAVVTNSTVGFGDIYPLTDLGRVCVIVMIFVNLGLMPPLFNKLSTVLSNTSEYLRNNYEKKSSESIAHIVILGNSHIEGFKTFINELYHVDHGFTDIPGVILQNGYPSKDMLQLIKQSIAKKIEYFQIKLSTLLYKDFLSSFINKN